MSGARDHLPPAHRRQLERAEVIIDRVLVVLLVVVAGALAIEAILARAFA